MACRGLRAAALGGWFLVAALAQPRESQAIFHWFCPSPPAPAYANYNPCATTCTYMPQTCYRTAYVYAPVTAYRPVMAYDPCSGCPTTALRPVTTYALRPQMVPYTTYRPVYGAVAQFAPTTAYYAPAFAPSGCSSCGAANYPTSAAMFAVPVAAGGCTACGAGASYAAPATGMPSYSRVVPAGGSIADVAPSMAAPSRPATNGATLSSGDSVYLPGPIAAGAAADGGQSRGTSTGAPADARSRLAPPAKGRTFKDDGAADKEPRAAQADGEQPIPADEDDADASERNKTNNTLWPKRLFDPSDRTTSRPIRRTALHVPVAPEPASTMVDGKADFGGWRPATK